LTVKAITFDFWSTLYQNKVIDYTKRLLELKEAVEECCGAGFSREQFEAAVKVARQTWGQTWQKQHRTMSAEEWLLAMLADLGASLLPEDLDRIRTKMENSVLMDRPILVTEARTVLEQLSASYRLAIISDTGITPGRVLRQILADDGLMRYFSHLTFSDEVGYSKPHPAAFLTTLEALEARPAEAVHVGDLLRTDIAGAQEVGMRAVQYIGVHRDEGPSSLLEPGVIIKPDAVIASHTELEPLLISWNGRVNGQRYASHA
jgi:HAD superfamily hydrolase (TIGR01549 family)